MDPLIASASADNTVRIWSLQRTSCLHVFTNATATWNTTIGSCYSAVHGPVVLVGCRNSELKMWALPREVGGSSGSGGGSGVDCAGTKDGDGDGGDCSDENPARRGSHSYTPTSLDPEDTNMFRLVRVIDGHPSRVTGLCVYNPNTHLNENGVESAQECDGEEMRGGDEDDGEGVEVSKKRRRFSSGRVSHMNAGPVVVTACRDLVLRLWR